MNVAAWLDRAARADPARVAILHGTAPWATYGELARRVSRLAAGLRGRAGLAPGDRVALFMKNAPEYLEAEMKALPSPRFKGRPTKKTRRDYEKWLRSSDEE